MKSSDTKDEAKERPRSRLSEIASTVCRRDTVSPTSLQTIRDNAAAYGRTDRRKTDNARKTISPNQMKHFLEELRETPIYLQNDEPKALQIVKEDVSPNQSFTDAFFAPHLLNKDDQLDTNKDRGVDRRDTLDSSTAFEFMAEMQKVKTGMLQSNKASENLIDGVETTTAAEEYSGRQTLDLNDIRELQATFTASIEHAKEGTDDTILVEQEPIQITEEREESVDIDLAKEIIQEFAELRAASQKGSQSTQEKPTRDIKVVGEISVSIASTTRNLAHENERNAQGSTESEITHDARIHNSLIVERNDESSEFVESKQNQVSAQIIVDKAVKPGTSPDTPSAQHKTKEPAKVELADSVPSNSSLLSPPPTHPQTKLLLRSCLSSLKKQSRLKEVTPSKSVAFGPPQGAEFNYGSPSTSMTPMCANTAEALFPLEKTAIVEEDVETALNSSILDEVDTQIGGSDEDRTDEHCVKTLGPSPRMALKKSKRQSLGCPIEVKVPQKQERRFSLSGVTPLYNIANARRKRKSLASGKDTSPKTQPFETLSEHVEKITSDPPSASQNVFISNTQPQSRTAFADSSASSDEDEDMDITGEYSNHFNVSAALIHLPSSAYIRPSAEPNNEANPFIQTNNEIEISTSPKFNEDGEKSTRSSSIGCLSANSPTIDSTKELGTLSDLIIETADLEQVLPEHGDNITEAHGENDTISSGDDIHLSSLSELNITDRSSERSSQAHLPKNDTSKEDDEPSLITRDDLEKRVLDPISEGEENSVTSTSIMSIVVSDEDTSEHRKSIVVNLSSHFDRVPTEPAPSPVRKMGLSEVVASKPPENSFYVSRKLDVTQSFESLIPSTKVDASLVLKTPTKPASTMLQSPPRVPRMTRTFEQLYTTLQLDKKEICAIDSTKYCTQLSENAKYSFEMQSVRVRDLVAACCNIACLEELDKNQAEITSWSTAADEVLASLNTELVPALFGSHNLPNNIVECVDRLATIVAENVQAHYFDWRAKIEKSCISELALKSSIIRSDTKQLKDKRIAILEHEENEIAALEDLIVKERRWTSLLTAIAEQEIVELDFKNSLQTLETECSSIELDVSVWKQRLADVQKPSDAEPMDTHEIQNLMNRVSWSEHKFRLLKRLAFWHLEKVEPPRLTLGSNFVDLAFTTHCLITLQKGQGDTSTKLNVRFELDAPNANSPCTKRRKLGVDHSDIIKRDAVYLIAQFLFDARYIESVFSRRKLRGAHLAQQLEVHLRALYNFLKDLRSLSKRRLLKYDPETNTLWVHIIRCSNDSVGSVCKISVGYEIYRHEAVGPETHPVGSVFLAANPSVAIQHHSIKKQRILEFTKVQSRGLEFITLETLGLICADISDFLTKEIP